MRMVMFVLGLALFAFAMIAGQKQMRDGGFAAASPAMQPGPAGDQAGMMAAMLARAGSLMGSAPGSSSATAPSALPQVSPQMLQGPDGQMTPADMAKVAAEFEKQFANSPAGAMAMPMITAKRKATKGGARFVKAPARN